MVLSGRGMCVKQGFIDGNREKSKGLFLFRGLSTVHDPSPWILTTARPKVPEADEVGPGAGSLGQDGGPACRSGEGEVIHFFLCFTTVFMSGMQLSQVEPDVPILQRKP